jgi:glycine reductase
MVKELERAGIPTVQICTMVNVALRMGTNRIVPSRSVLYPTGDPSLTPDEEIKLRHQIIKRALEAVQTDIEEQTVFETNS